MTKPKVPTEILLERIPEGLGVADRHVHMARLQANQRQWDELAKTIELTGTTIAKIADDLADLMKDGRRERRDRT